MAQLFQTQYTSVYSDPKPEFKVNSPEHFFTESPLGLNTLEFSDEDMIKAINSMNSNSASGPDGFPAILLKHLAQELAFPLKGIWTESVRSGQIPEVFKLGVIAPIHKGGSRNKCSQYRPVTLTSILSRTFEKIIRDKIVTYLEENNLINESQHGFRKGRSCLSQLLTYYDNILVELAANKNVDVVMTDFSKCFDRIDFGILLHKMKKLGISGEIGRWLHTFLVGRKSKVKVGTATSEESIAESGLPQGTCLGPVLLIIMNHDIDDNIENSKPFNFADDGKLLKSVSNKSDIQLFQQDLQTLYQWAEDNNMKYNEGKFVLLRFGNIQDLKETPLLGPSGTALKEEDHARDLGVCMSNEGNFDKHVNNVVGQSQKIVGMILRSFKTRDPLPMLQLFKTLVLSKIDYCSILWSPSNIENVRKLEKVQSNFTRRLNGMTQENNDRIDYWDRLKKLHLYSIQRRHERYQQIYMWKIKLGLVCNPGVTFFSSDRRGVLAKITNMKQYSKLRESSFLVKGPRLFNVLPIELRNYNGPVSLIQEEEADCKNLINGFKRKLDKFLMNIPDHPNLSSEYSQRILTTDITGKKSNSLIDVKFC